MKYLVFLFALPALALAQSDRDESNALRLLTWEYSPTAVDTDFGDSTLIYSPSRAILAVKLSVRFDSLWTWSDTVKIGETGASMIRPGNLFGCSLADRGSDSTQGPAVFVRDFAGTVITRDLYLYHVPAGGRVGTATIKLEYWELGPAATALKTTAWSETAVGTATLSLAVDSVQIVMPDFRATDIIVVGYLGNAQFSIAALQTMIGAKAWGNGKFTIYGVGGKQVAYIVRRAAAGG